MSSWLGLIAPDSVETSLRASLLLLSRERVNGLSSSCTGVGRLEWSSSIGLGISMMQLRRSASTTNRDLTKSCGLHCRAPFHCLAEALSCH